MHADLQDHNSGWWVSVFMKGYDRDICGVTVFTPLTPAPLVHYSYAPLSGKTGFFIVILNVKLTFLHLIILQPINYSDENYLQILAWSCQKDNFVFFVSNYQ